MEKVKRYGTIVSLSGEIAYVCVKHAYGCSENHKSCPFGKNFTNSGEKDFIVKAQNRLHAKEGQLVEISIADRKLSGYAFMLFIFPIIMILLGSISGYFISNIFTTNNAVFSVIGGILGFLCSLYIIRIIDKRAKDSFIVTRIIS